MLAAGAPLRRLRSRTHAHPRILGKAIDPFWAMYASHKEKHIYEILEKYRIGNFIPPKEAAVGTWSPMCAAARLTAR